jgi:hypothetical protein
MSATPIQGVDYDIADPVIVCNADKAGAQVFEIDVHCFDDDDDIAGWTEIIRVLAFHRDAAEELAKVEARNRA